MHTDLYQWQLNAIKKNANIEIKVNFTGEELEGFKVIDAVHAVTKHANGQVQIEKYIF